MIYRCPVCRTRRHSQALLTRHIEQSGHHRLCCCKGYDYPHRPGSKLCVTETTPPPEPKRKRGRPAKPDALTPAERAARYRAKKAAAKAAKPPMWRGKNGETWSGKGQRPKWFQAHLDLYGLPDFS